MNEKGQRQLDWLFFVELSLNWLTPTSSVFFRQLGFDWLTPYLTCLLLLLLLLSAFDGFCLFGCCFVAD